MIERRIDALKNALTDDDLQVREAAGVALDQLEGLKELPQLISQLSTGDRSTRIAMVYALGRVRSSKVFVPLLEALKAEDPDLRTAAARILGEKHHPKTLSALVKSLDDPEMGVVAEVVTALGQFSDPRLSKLLGPLVTRKEQIALAAINSLGRLGFPEGEDALLKALNDERPPVRRHAAGALGKLQFSR